MKEERMVFASKSIVDLAENAGVAGKLNSWADLLKFVMLVCCIIMIISGCFMLPSAIGWGLIISAIFQGFLAFFYFHLLRAGAVITEAASIFVLEHKEEKSLIAAEKKESNVQKEEKQEDDIKPFEVGEEVIVIKSGISTTIKEIKDGEIYLSNGIFGDTFKVNTSEIKRKK